MRFGLVLTAVLYLGTPFIGFAELSSFSSERINTKGNLPAAKVDVAKGKVKLSVDKNDFESLKLSDFTYCSKVTLAANGKREHSASEKSKNGKFKFAVEVRGGENRLILHNYKKGFGDSFSWVNKPTEFCISWVGRMKEFHLYLEGRHVLGGIGNIESGLVDKVKDVISKGKTRETLGGPVTELTQWKRALSKDEVLQVANGKLKGEIVPGKSPNWKLTATAITESYQPPPTAAKEDEKTCAHPTASVLDSIPLKINDMTPFVETSIKFPEPWTKKFEELSICAWIYYKSIEDLPVRLLLYYGVGNIWVLSFHIWKNEMHYGWNELIDLISAPAIEPGKWHHICFTWSEIRNSTVNIYHDGIRVLQKQVTKGSACIGKEIFFYGPFDPENPTKGYTAKITGINMWDYPLTPKEVVQSYTCPAKYPGNFISWEKSGKAYNPTV